MKIEGSIDEGLEKLGTGEKMAEKRLEAFSLSCR